MKANKKQCLISTALFATLAIAAQAEILVSQASIAATQQAGEPSAIFMQLENNGNENVQLAFVESEIPARFALHGMQQGRMTDLNTIEIPAHQRLSLKHGGQHIMVFDLPNSLKQGETFPISLFFDNGEVVRTKAVVQ
ncbi:copper chaperone PCu(A)C [Avibacterium paragallinarum]|uniref:copper chaperone PCu(A)C n=1 Tax=Avibacterium paragallinarum TaxID=728 RepID=UPI0021F6A690|nr:copper chaperone PCu(A)C [Avibacterium paragallinarum]UXN34773.1 copper chaperone PCu(A)C [Avibacterium paragallinarum]